jgi:hypothetical protein
LPERGKGVKKAIAEKLAQAKERAENPPSAKAGSGSEATQFKPGVSQNPGPGRPASPLPLSAGPLVRQRLAEIDSGDHRKRQKVARIIDTLFEIATNPKAPTACVKAADALLDRAWGKPIQSIEQTVTFKSREEEMEFIKQTLGWNDHDNGTQSIN